MLDYLAVFFTAMVPVFELRAAIPLGALNELNWVLVYILAVIGNILPIPIILLFVRRVFAFMKKRGGRIERIALWFENKGLSKSNKVTKYATFGLFLFVAIPLPGTGAWTGSLIAALTNMRFKHSIISVSLGVVCAGIIMLLAGYGSVSALKFLL